MNFRFHLIVLLMSVMAQLSPAQTVVPAHVIKGSVLDPSGAVIPGALVDVFTQSGKLIAQGVSDSGGNFSYSEIPNGSYVIDVTKAGFNEVKKPQRVGSGTVQAIQIVMSVAGVAEEMTVAVSDTNAQVSTEIALNQSSNSIDRDALDRIPLFDQDYLTTMSRFLDADSTGTNGVTLVVNGVEANGPGVTASAIQSVKINQNPYTALYSRPGRARIELTTKGGTAQLHGSATFLYRDSLFDAQNKFATTKPAEQRTYYEGSLTGPLSRNKKTTFLLALDYDQNDQQAIVVAAGPNGAINQNVPNPTHHSFFSGRVFHDYREGKQLWVGYSYEQRSVRNQGVGGTVLPEAGTDTMFLEHEINVGYTHVFSPRLLNQLHFLVGHNDNRTQDVNEAPQLNVSGAFTGGSAQADYFRTESHFDGSDIVTYTKGKHEIKFGVDVPDMSRRGYDNFTNQLGTYSFADLNHYTAAQPFSYLVQQGYGHVSFVERTVAGIFEDTARLRPNLSVSVGVRYYWQNYFHDVPWNFGPRLSFAYAPSAKSRTVIRGGAGMFFDRSGPSPISDLLLFNGVQLRRYLVNDPSYPITQPELTGVPTSVVVLDPKERMPYTLQYGVGIEQQLNARTSLFANYIGSRGIGMFRSVDANAPPPPNYVARLNSSLGQEREIQPDGYMKSNALEVGFRGRPVSYFTGQARYSLGKTYNNTSGITYFPANSNFPNADWSRSDNDQRNRFDLLGTLEAGKLFDFGTALSLYSGKPVNITTGSDNNNDGLPLDRPAGVPRNLMHGPGYIDLDLNLSHDFSLTKNRKDGPIATLSINSFNVLNHPNYVTYVGVVTSPFFGMPVSAQPPRRMQFSLQVKF
jgi:Carboxypeptidase regulatory-like domain